MQDVDEDQEPLEIDALDEEEEAEPPFYGITSYGADYPVESIVRKLNSGDLFVPSFQRAYVWSIKKASQFVESLLLGLPVPGIFIARENETNRHIVVDGSQRLRTLQYFFKGLYPPTKKEFALTGVAKQFDGKNFSQLDAADRRRLEDAILHTTVIRQDEPSDDDSGIFQVFRRLNLGGTPLSPQEVRHALYHGPLVELLEDLNRDDAWRELFGPESKRLRDREMILRFFAMLELRESYKKPMSSFLNRYMKYRRSIDKSATLEMQKTFVTHMKQIRSAVGKNAFRPLRNFNAAFFEGAAVGLTLAERALGRSLDSEAICRGFQRLREDGAFNELVTRATSDKDTVDARIKRATAAFLD